MSMPAILIFVFLLIVLFVLGRVIRAAGGSRTALNEAWMKAAGDLGLAFIRPDGIGGAPAIEGEIDGFHIDVLEDMNPDRTFYLITFPESSNISFLAIRENGGEYIKKEFEGLVRHEKVLKLPEDIAATCAVSAKRESMLCEYLTPGRLDALIRCFRHYRNETVKINDDSIAVICSGIECDPEKICDRINTALLFAKLFDIRAKESVPEKRETADPPPAPPEISLEQEKLLPLLFANPMAGQKEKELFESVKGAEVRWTGTLRSVFEFGMDFTFGNAGGVKATIDLMEIQGSYGMKSKIKAVACFPKEQQAELRALNGRVITFRGNLLKIETFAKEIYLDSAALEPNRKE